MGREWLYWGSGSGTSNKSTSQRGRRRKGEQVMNNINEEATPPPGGCMCFQIFDLPHFQLALNQQSRSLKPHHHSSFLQPDPETSLLKGLEAPRNSLELDTERKSVSSSLSSSSTMKVDEQNLNIPVCIPIRTSCDSRSPRVSTSGSRTRTDHDISSECSSSSPAGTKTPTLVARLMGLDLLPENNNSPRISTSTNCNTKNNNNQLTHHQSGSKNRRRFSSFESSDTNYITTGTLSLPETPRISLARRSDVEQQQQHRLSLQINKENMGDAFEFSDSSSTSSVCRKMSRYNRRSFYEQENENQTRSPGYYARQIVKQVKESVSRKVGHDITNTIRRKDDQLTAKCDQVVLLKPKKPSHGNGDDFRPSKQTTPSCSPRFRFLEPKNSTSTSSTKHHSPRFSPLSPLPESSTLLPVTKPKPQKEQLVQQKTIQKRKGEKFAAKKPLQACDAIWSKKEELFVRSAAVTNKSNFADKKSKLKTPLSNQLVNTSTVHTILPSRKDPSPSPTKLHIKQESDTYPWKRKRGELSSSLSQSYYSKPPTLEEMKRDKCNGAISVDFHSQYIQRILKRTGLDKSTPISLAKWYSPSQPLDPAIFHYLELFNFTAHNSTPRCNRKLIFQLVDELLVEMLMKKHFNRGLMDGEELMDTLCARIRSFPSANCQVLEDIDALIDKDMQKWDNSFDEQVESIVCEMERDIMEEVVHDTVKKEIIIIKRWNRI